MAERSILWAAIAVFLFLLFRYRIRLRAKEAPIAVGLVTKAWEIPTELKNSPAPRNVALSSFGKFQLACIGFLLLCLIIVGVFKFYEGRVAVESYRNLSEKGWPMVAHITNKIYDARSKSASPSVTYSFEVDGRTYLGRTHLNEALFNQISIGDEKAGTFLPDDPAQSHLDLERKPLPAYLSPFIVGLFMLLPLSFFPYTIRKEWVLLQNGNLTSGSVKTVIRTRGGHILRYEFSDLEGHLLSGAGQVRANKILPAVGDRVSIIYSSENAKRNRPYPMPYVELRELS